MAVWLIKLAKSKKEAQKAIDEGLDEAQFISSGGSQEHQRSHLCVQA